MLTKKELRCLMVGYSLCVLDSVLSELDETDITPQDEIHDLRFNLLKEIIKLPND